jgi:hypothetical protein
MKRIIPLIFLLLCLYCGGRETFAQCDCGYGSPDLAPDLAHRDFKLADVVFIGKVAEIERVVSEDKDYDIVVTFAVRRAWKQNVKETVALRNFEGCDRGYKLGEEWLVYGYERGDGSFRIDCCCSGTKLLSRADVDLKTFEEKDEKPARILKGKSKAKAQPNNSLNRSANSAAFTR